MVKRLIVLLSVLSTAIWVTGCSLENAPTTATAKAAVCQGLAAVQAAASGLATVDANTRVSDLQGAKQRLDTAVEALRRANEVLQQEQVTQLVTSYDSLSQSITQVANQETLGAAAGAIQSAGAGVIDALNQANAALQCSQ